MVERSMMLYFHETGEIVNESADPVASDIPANNFSVTAAWRTVAFNAAMHAVVPLAAFLDNKNLYEKFTRNLCKIDRRILY
jgi:hypothetical protein